jgi:hypothetical protein
MTEIKVPDEPRFQKVREEIDLGRLWKARDRLHGHVRRDPSDQKVLDLLGSIWFVMGDLPQAGRYWFLTTRDDESVARARDAFFERFGGDPLEILRALPPRIEPDRYPHLVRKRIDDLVAASGSGHGWWTPKTSDDDDWRPVTPAAYKHGSTRRGVDALLSAFMTAVVVVALVSLVVGFVTIVGWILDLFV